MKRKNKIIRSVQSKLSHFSLLLYQQEKKIMFLNSNIEVFDFELKF